MLRAHRPARRPLAHRLRGPAPDHLPHPLRLPGPPDARRLPALPSRAQVRDYLVGVAEQQGLLPLIRFGTEMLSVEPVAGPDGADGADVGAAGWRVTTSAGDAGTYDGVLVANGHLWDPALPKIPCEFTGRSLHSSQYRNTGDIEGDRVLVVGSGNSGCDLAVDAAQARLDVAVSVRSDPALLRWRDGVPLKVRGHIVPAGLEKLYFVGLVGPRGPQFPVYTAQAQAVTEFIAAHAAAPGGSAGLAARLADVDPADARTDIVRGVWQAQLDRTRRLVASLPTAVRA